MRVLLALDEAHEIRGGGDDAIGKLLRLDHASARVSNIFQILTGRSQNVGLFMITTLDLPQDIVIKAQGVAAARQTTLQALVVEGLRNVLGASTSDDFSSEEALRRLRAGFHLGGTRALTRDEAHAR